MDEHSINHSRDVLVKDVKTLRRDALKIVDDVKEHATAHVDETKKRVTDTIDLAKTYAKDHPFAVLGVGVVLGLLLARRRRR